MSSLGVGCPSALAIDSLCAVVGYVDVSSVVGPLIVGVDVIATLSQYEDIATAELLIWCVVGRTTSLNGGRGRLGRASGKHSGFEMRLRSEWVKSSVLFAVR